MPKFSDGGSRTITIVLPEKSRSSAVLPARVCKRELRRQYHAHRRKRGTAWDDDGRRKKHGSKNKSSILHSRYKQIHDPYLSLFVDIHVYSSLPLGCFCSALCLCPRQSLVSPSFTDNTFNVSRHPIARLHIHLRSFSICFAAPMNSTTFSTSLSLLPLTKHLWLTIPSCHHSIFFMNAKFHTHAQNTSLDIWKI